jgi:hypothetical protein
VWLFRTVFLSLGRIVSHNPLSVFLEGSSTSTCLRKGRSTRSMIALRRPHASLCMQGKCCHKTLNPCCHESKKVWMSRPWIESLPSRCTTSPQKIKSKTLLMLRQWPWSQCWHCQTHLVRCRMQDQWWRAPWLLSSSAKVMGEQWKQGGRGRMREGEDGNNRGGQQQQCLSSSNQMAIRKHKKAHKKTQQSSSKTEVMGMISC